MIPGLGGVQQPVEQKVTPDTKDILVVQSLPTTSKSPPPAQPQPQHQLAQQSHLQSQSQSQPQSQSQSQPQPQPQLVSSAFNKQPSHQQPSQSAPPQFHFQSQPKQPPAMYQAPPYTMAPPVFEYLFLILILIAKFSLATAKGVQ